MCLHIHRLSNAPFSRGSRIFFLKIQYTNLEPFKFFLRILFHTSIISPILKCKTEICISVTDCESNSNSSVNCIVLADRKYNLKNPQTSITYFRDICLVIDLCQLFQVTLELKEPQNTDHENKVSGNLGKLLLSKLTWILF